jgi:uncharacterized protein (TIGR02594 family)
MKTCKKRVAVLLCSVALAAVAGSAFARPRQQALPAAALQADAADRDMRYAAPAQAVADPAPAAARRHSRHGRRATTPSDGSTAFAAFSGNSLVEEARKYLGTNPTGRASLWCGAFMDMVLKRTGHPGGGNLALGYKNYGTRVAGPQVGAIAVMSRRGGGHVGVVSGVDANGNPIIVSGNHNRTVAESVYPRSRIIAYVMP